MSFLQRLLLLQGLVLLIFVELGAALVTDKEWEEYKRKYNKHYPWTIPRRRIPCFPPYPVYETHTDSVHRSMYERSSKAVQSNNLLYDQGLVGFRLELNQFSDEIPILRRSFAPPPSSLDPRPLEMPANYKPYDEIQHGIDWRQFGYISREIGQQEKFCLNSWAYSATGALEAHLAKKSGQLVALSPQQLLRCVPSGCRDGWVSGAFSYIRDHGIASVESYSNTNRWDRDCTMSTIGNSTLKGFVTLNSGDEMELAEVVYNIGPVAVSIDYHPLYFTNYASGILNIPFCSSAKEDIGHSVLVVGFGTDDTWGDYWLIKNSMGESWGEKGYFRLARNANNMCGVASRPQYPIV